MKFLHIWIYCLVEISLIVVLEKKSFKGKVYAGQQMTDERWSL